MRFSAVVLILPIIIFIGLIFLQIWLSKRPGKLPGLILPALSFLFSLFVVIGMIMFTNVASMDGELVTRDENGYMVARETMSEVSGSGAFEMGGMLIGTVAVFVICNIPTVILLAIYFGVKGNGKKQELEKMNIQDLE